LLGTLFYCRYNAKKKNLKLIGTDFIGLIFGKMVDFLFAESCMSIAHNVESNKGQRKTWRKARIINRAVIPERNVVRADIMVAPLDIISEIIQTYHWGYLHNCACIVLTRLVREFYAHLEVVQIEDSGIILQSTIVGHAIMVDPQVISQIIGVPVLQISTSPFNEVVVAPSLDDLREFFHVVPQDEERATTIRIGVLSPPHRMLTKIIQHNL